ncbi:hypothetical protein FB45DRAFT_876179 [Roridomyces roridus]|uniref:Uncharacterized protein n=1 Tax=Roridomyces roridus TaxID=1738132 RepID=A0AAD7FC12_9AGAR|nr:hypothetical protein FB45DRAFT_876179 [Roridomyces roridus]
MPSIIDGITRQCDSVANWGDLVMPSEKPMDLGRLPGDLSTTKSNGLGVQDFFSISSPHIRAPLSAPVLKAVKNYLLRTFEVSEDKWRKISFLNGGDKIRGADLVESSEKNMTREASFIKQARTVWLTVIRPVKLLQVGKSKCLGIPFYKDNAPIEGVDVDDLKKTEWGKGSKGAICAEFEADSLKQMRKYSEEELVTNQPKTIPFTEVIGDL